MQIFQLREINKRIFDLFFSALGLALLFWLIFLLWIVASIDTWSNGLFLQVRIGKCGKPFKLLKIKSMKDTKQADSSSITALEAHRVTVLGKFLRKYKLDELPQLWNIFCGDMSFVGPRPDVPGYADRLIGDDRLLLKLRPGITGPASIKYKNEESLLMNVSNPREYNDEVIWPDKVRINLRYFHNHSISGDIKCLLETVGLLNNSEFD